MPPPANPSVSPGTPSGAPPSRGGRCVQHPDSPTVARCDKCGAMVCATCQFFFPINLNVCPVCLVAGTKVSSQRTLLAVGGLIATALSITFLAATIMGALGVDPGIAFALLVLLPAAVGLALSYSAMDRNRGNNALLWTSSAIASVQMGLMLFFIILGLAKGGA